MNNGQRTTIRKALDALRPFSDASRLEELQATGKGPLQKVMQVLESAVSDIADEEREKFDNLSEGLQNAATGQKLEEYADALENIDWIDLDDDFSDGDKLAERIESLIEDIEAAIE